MLASSEKALAETRIGAMASLGTRRRLVYGLWLAVQRCPDRVNEVVLATYREAIADANARSACRHTAIVPQAPGIASSAVCECVRDAALLESTGRGEVSASVESMWATPEARRFAGSDTHLSFYPNDSRTLARCPRYSKPRLFGFFLAQFLIRLREASVPGWAQRSAERPKARKRDSRITDLVDSYVSRIRRRIKDVGRPSLVDREGSAVADVLQEFVARGFVLHGSAAHVDRLRPKRGNCLSGTAAGNLEALYITRDPLTAVFRATRKNAPFFNCWAGIETRFASNKIFAGERRLARYKGHAGYVYVLRAAKTGSSKFPHQLLRGSQCPCFRVRVEPSDFTGTVHVIPPFEVAFIHLIGQSKQRLLATGSRR